MAETADNQDQSLHLENCFSNLQEHFSFTKAGVTIKQQLLKLHGFFYIWDMTTRAENTSRKEMPLGMFFSHI